MKRICSMFLVVVVLSLMAVSASAADTNTLIYGNDEFPTYQTIENIDTIMSQCDNMYIFSYIGAQYLIFTKTPLTYHSDGYLRYPGTSANSYGFFLDGDTWSTNDPYGIANRTYFDARALWFSSVDIFDEDGSLYVAAEHITKPTCNGSVCPATDVNIDSICDDCGGRLFSLTRPPVAPDVSGSNKNYVMFYSDLVYKYTVYTSDVSYTIHGEEYGTRYRTFVDPSVTVRRYESYDGINWEQTYTGTTANDYPGEIGYELISSTFDWYTEEGDRFFPVPLWEEVQTVTQGEMGNLTSKMGGTMKILVVCGVGLMAFLVALKLFGKVSFPYLRK